MAMVFDDLNVKHTFILYVLRSMYTNFQSVLINLDNIQKLIKFTCLIEPFVINLLRPQMGGPGPGYRVGMPPTSQSMMQQGKGMYKVFSKQLYLIWSGYFKFQFI